MLYPRIHVVNSLDYGGSESQMLNLAFRYSEMKLEKEVIFLALGKGGIVANKIDKLGFKVITLNASTQIPNWSLLWKLRRVFKQHHLRLAIFNGAESIFHGVPVAKLSRIHWIFTEHIGISNHTFKGRIVFLILNALASGNIAASEVVMQNLIAQREARTKKILVNYPPIKINKTEILESKELTTEVIKFLYCGRLEAVKNLDGLIRALHNVSSLKELKLWRFDIVGEGSQQNKLIKLVSELGLESNIFFHSKQSNLENWYLSANFYIQASFSEGCGLSLLEAIQYGLPVLSTKVGVAEHVIRSGLNGFLCQSSSIDAIYDQLVRIFELNEEQWRVLKKGTQHTSLNSFTAEAYLRRLANWIDTYE